MPIRRYVGNGVFTSEALSAMSKAFEAAIWTLGIDRDEMKREAVARFIIQLAQEDGDNLDATTFHRKAVTAFADPVVAVLIKEPGHGLAPAPGAGGVTQSGRGGSLE